MNNVLVRCVQNYDKLMPCLVLPQINEYLPALTFNSEKLNILETSILADPNFDKPTIDSLIEVNTFWDLLSIG